MTGERTAGDTRFRVTVDYGDDRIRNYAVWASDAGVAIASALAYANDLLSVDATDDWDDYFDVTPDYEWSVGDEQPDAHTHTNSGIPEQRKETP